MFDDRLIARSANALVNETDGNIVMMTIERGQYFSLNDIASDVWRRIEPPCSFGDLVRSLAADYDADEQQIAAHIGVFLDRMIAEDVIKLIDRNPSGTVATK